MELEILALIPHLHMRVSDGPAYGFRSHLV